MRQTEQIKERATSFTAVTYGKYEDNFRRTSHIFANKIFSTTNDESSITNVTYHAQFISLTF